MPEQRANRDTIGEVADIQNIVREVRVDEIRVGKIGALQNRVVDLAVIKRRATEITIGEIAAAEFTPGQILVGEIGTNQIMSRKSTSADELILGFQQDFTR